MNITKKTDAQKLTLAIEGRIDTTTAPEFEKEINAISDVTELILDFKGVEYISSAGLRVVLKAQKLMNQNGKMELTGVGDAVMEVFEITGFSDILTFA